MRNRTDLVLAFGVFAATVIFLPSSFAAESAPTSDPRLLREHVDVLVNQLSPRVAFASNLSPVAAYIFSEFEKYGEPAYQGVQLGIDEFRNIELTITGQSNETIIVGAHYDAYNGYPGADDNASGVAGLIELARMLSSVDLPVTVVFIAYTLEEPPYFGTPSMGSAHHARRSSKRSPVPFLMINFEMIGFFCDEPKCQKYPLPLLSSIYPDKGNYISVVGRGKEKRAVRIIKDAFAASTDMPVETITLPVPGADLSDHRNYWNEDIEAVMISDTAFQRNPNYHTKDDTPDTLDYERMAEVVNGTFASIISLGNQRVNESMR